MQHCVSMLSDVTLLLAAYSFFAFSFYCARSSFMRSPSFPYGRLMLPLTVRTHEGSVAVREEVRGRERLAQRSPRGRANRTPAVAGRRRRHRAMPRDRGHEQMGWAYVPEEGKIG